MKITVIHTAFEDDAKKVAEVNVTHTDDVMEALEYAYRWTNNVMGSWSIKEKTFDNGEQNNDFNEDVKVVADLHVDETGKTWGLRSTSMRDHMFVDTGAELQEAYEVAMMGFEKIGDIEVVDNMVAWR